jgi:hypothetical protein
MTNEGFAAKMGVAVRSVAKWVEQPDLVPTMTTQQMLDTMLASADGDSKQRFALLVNELTSQVANTLDPRSATANSERTRLPTLPLAVVRRRPTADTLTYLARALKDLYVTDNLLGPRILIPVINAHLETIDKFRTEATGTTLDGLLSIGAAYAEFAGWLCQDSGDMAGAAQWCGQALEWAEMADDSQFAAFVRMRRAAQCISLRQGEYAVRWAVAAQKYKHPNHMRIHAIAALMEAHGHALCGDASSTDRALDRATEIIDDRPHSIDGDPTSARYCELPLYLNISRAKCQLELGRGEEAVFAFDLVLSDLPDDFHRDRGQYLASLASAHLLVEQPEQACAVASESLAIAVTTGSARTVVELCRSIPKGLTRWRDLPEGVALLASLKSAQITNGGA